MKIAISILILFLSTFSFSQNSTFIPDEIMNSKVTTFELSTIEGGFLLESCIPDSLYNPGLIRPIEMSGRTIMQYNTDYTPLTIMGGKWLGNCYTVSYFQSELDDSDWIDLILTFTILKQHQVVLNHK